MSKHWSERLMCGGCGKAFRSVGAEAQHRHCFPLLCRRPRALKQLKAEVAKDKAKAA